MVAWTLWKDGKGSDFVEPWLMECCPKAEVLKCLQIALLCVQEDVEERPTMSAVIIVLLATGTVDSIGLPEPRKLAKFAIDRVAQID
ncbi:hypothetical protein M0R45_000259 [Rubus argutus]|uniref:S-locus receptor kinase C-terminal domain-containing protein n=1 Tax=Rubus argutus TaxID=59490 RepID=A0AAW1VL87_RUBAR